MTRDDETVRLAAHAELQGFGSCAALMLEGYLLLVLAEAWNLIFLGVLLGACLWRLWRVRGGGGRLIDWTRTSHRVVGSVAFLCLGFGSAAVGSGAAPTLGTGTVYFLGAVVVWVETLILLSRWRGPGVLRALTYLSLFHVVLAAFVVRPAATAPLLLVYLFLVVRTLGVADRRVGDVPEYGRFLALDAGTFAAVSALAIAVFLLLPRPNFASAAAGDADRERARPPSDYEPPVRGGRPQVIGFGPDMDLTEEIPELILDKRVALRVNQIEIPPQSSMSKVLPEMRLRGIWFDTWNGRRWSRTTGVQDRFVREDWIRVPDDEYGEDPTLPPFGTTGTAHDTWSARIQLVPLFTRACFVPPGLRAIQQRVLVTDGEEGWYFPAINRQPLTYRIEALVLLNHRSSEARVRRFAEDSLFLQVAGPHEKFRALAQDLIFGKSDDPARILAIQDYLSEKLDYTLSVPELPPEADAVEQFLFQRKSGFCIHFATAMTMLLRSIDIPCRIAGGYVSQEWDPERGEYLVRQMHAHAWVEVPFEGLGWVPFDPTPLPERVGEETLGELERVQRAGPRPPIWDFLVDLENFDRQRFLTGIGDWIADLARAALGRSGSLHAAGVWTAACAVGLLFAGALVWLRRTVAGRRSARAGAVAGPGGRGPAVPFYRDLQRLAARRGLVRAVAETPAEFARRVDLVMGTPAAGTVVDAYYHVLFGRRALSPAEQQAVREALAALESAIEPIARN